MDKLYKNERITLGENLMANNFKKKVKFISSYIWTLFKGSVLTSIMYFCSSAILMMLIMKGEKIDWSNTDIIWTVVCIIGAGAYNAIAAWANGGMHYEMLVSGNVKRSTLDAYGNDYKMSKHKFEKEYRVWKGFVMGAFTAIVPIIFGLLCGANQATIDSGKYGKGVAALVILAFFLSGWTIMPFYCMNKVGIGVSYYLSILFALIPILISGFMYIGGAYSRRNKAIRQQLLAEQAERAEEEKKKNKKINYGGLPGTKPKKRK